MPMLPSLDAADVYERCTKRLHHIVQLVANICNKLCNFLHQNADMAALTTDCA